MILDKPPMKSTPSGPISLPSEVSCDESDSALSSPTTTTPKPRRESENEEDLPIESKRLMNQDNVNEEDSSASESEDETIDTTSEAVKRRRFKEDKVCTTTNSYFLRYVCVCKV